MKQNPLLIAVLVLVVLGGLVYYTRENPPEPESNTIPLVRVEEADILRVTVVRPGGETIVVEREADKPWTFGGGVTVPADDSAINLMITNLAALDASRLVQKQTTDWAPYGLDGDGRLRVTMETSSGDPKSIIFGEDTPTGSSVFARLDGDPQLFTAFGYARDNFNKTVFDWRDKRLLRVTPDLSATITLDIGTRHFKFLKDVRSWKFIEPPNLRANRLSVGDLESELTNAQMSSVLAEGDESAINQYSFERPYAVAAITDASGSHTLTLAEGGPSGFYAKSSDLPGVYEAPASLAAALDKQVDDFREPKLFDFGFEDVSRIDVRDGQRRMTVEKQAEDWKLTTDGGRVVAAEPVQALIDALRALSAISFPANDAPAQARYGLGAPAIEAETRLALDVAPPEKVIVSDLSQPQVYAARVGEGPTYEVEKEAALKVRQALDAILAPAPAAP
jgi:hypothetical protein